jgi:hypothetical protein
VATSQSLAKQVGATFRDDKLVTRTARYVQQVGDNSFHRKGIYPAEMSHGERCQRAIHYRLTDAESTPSPTSIVSELIFNHGNTSHDWWQQNWWGMGILKGVFHCMACDLYWEDLSPYACPRCDMPRMFLEYKEVPFRSREYNMVGRADADLTTDGLIEIKTIGVGSVRFEAPHLVEKHGENMEALWRDIKHPFPSHRKQGILYCHFLEREQITFIYDPKFVSAAPKEFVVQYNASIIEDILEECLLINRDVALGRVPKRPEWAEKSHRTCARCPYRKVCYAPSIRRNLDVTTVEEGAGA